MTDHRATAAKAARDTLGRLAALGVAQNLWTTRVQSDDTASSPRWVRVEMNATGYAYHLSAGNWNEAGTISVSLAEAERDGLKVGPRDCIKYGEAVPRARSSASRGAEAIMKDFTRRVFNDARALEIQAAMAERLGHLSENRTGLRAHMAALAELGYRFDRTPEEATYAADGYSDNRHLPRIKVFADGSVSFEMSCSVDKLAAVLLSSLPEAA